MQTTHDQVSDSLEVLKQRIGAADERVFAAVATYQSRPLDRVLPSLSVAASYSRIWAGVAATLVVFGGRRERIAAVEGVIAVAITSVLANLVLKRAIPRQRPKGPVPDSRELPDPRFVFVPLLVTLPPEQRSQELLVDRFPSGWGPLNALAAVIGFSRVYTGVHHPSDIVAGWVVGKIVASGVRRSHIVAKLASRFPARDGHA